MKFKVTGVDLVTNAISEDSESYKNAEKIAKNYPSISFPSRLES